MKPTTVVLIVLVGAWSVMAKKSGAPVADYPDICRTMMPQHDGYDAMDSDSPYEVVFDSDCFGVNTEHTVLVREKSGEDAEIEGIFVQVKTKDNNVLDEAGNFGTFAVTDPILKTITCHDNAESAFTQNQEKGAHCREAKWTSPSTTPSDDLVFVATVVQEKHDFWVGIESSTFSACAQGVTPTYSTLTCGARGVFVSFGLLVASVLLALVTRH